MASAVLKWWQKIHNGGAPNLIILPGDALEWSALDSMQWSALDNTEWT